MRARLAALAVAAFLAGNSAAAQETAQLAADTLRIEADSRLVAEGNVEVFYRGARLQASRVVYIRGQAGTPDRLEITGPIALDDGARVVIVAEEAALTADLRDGVMQGARLILDRQLQMAATTVIREGGRYTRLEQAVASSCRVCAERPIPLWEIRAARVEHDEVEREIRFERAELRVAGARVAVLPRLTMPDPTVERATGFLAPAFEGSRRLGFGVQLPYFIALAPDRDLLLLPRVTTEASLTFGARYRQAFAAGTLELAGALTRDRLRPGEWRGFASASGAFALPVNTRLTFRAVGATDRRYFDDYESDRGGRDSFVQIDRLRRNTDALARFIRYDDPRRDIDGDTQPNLEGRLRLVRRFAPPMVGGTGRLTLETIALKRDSPNPVGGIGRDQAHAALRLEWRRNWLLPGGLAASALADLQADHTGIRQDEAFPGSVTRFSPVAGIELRWPLVSAGRGGARHLIEPVAQVVLASSSLDPVPDETSRLVEFDESSLVALHRFPGSERRELGHRLNLALSYSRFDPAGWQLALTGGRVLRLERGEFSTLSGLGGRRSDWLAAARLSAGDFDLAGRALIDDNGSSVKQELRVAYATDRFAAAGSFLDLAADPQEDRAERVRELGLDGRLRLDPNWEILGDAAYDLERGEALRGGLTARFRNECLALDLSLSRRYQSSTSVATETVFGIRVDLLGFGSAEPGPARPCVR